jgi:IS5 family transposase
LNDTVVILLPPGPLEVTVLRETDPQTTIWELLLPDEAKRLPAELTQVDTYLDDERFIAPWRALFDRRLGRPSVPIDTLLRLLYFKHRYGLGYESLCREVSDSIGWRRFCRIPLDRPIPHPTTLVKLVGRAGPEVTEQLNTAVLGKLAEDRLLRGRKLRVDTTVVEADIDHPTDADLLEKAVRKLGGLVRRIKQRGAAHPYRVPGPVALGGTAAQADLPHAAAANRPGASGGRPSHRRGHRDRAAGAGAGRAGGGSRSPCGWAMSWRRAAATAGGPAGADHHRDPAASGPDPSALARRPGDPGSAGVVERPRRPSDP